MDQKQLDALKIILTNLGYIAGVVITIWKFIDAYLTKQKQSADEKIAIEKEITEREVVKERERSVGATKILEFIEKDKAFEKDIQALQNEDERLDERIKQVQTDRREMMELMKDFFRMKN